MFRLITKRVEPDSEQGPDESLERVKSYLRLIYEQKTVKSRKYEVRYYCTSVIL